MSTIISIDIGTTNCKAIIINKTGNILFACKKSYPSITDEHGKNEQDSELIFSCVLALLQQAVQACNNQEISAISFSAAMHSIMAVDAEGKPLTNSITWADTRSKHYADIIINDADYATIYNQTGTPVHAMSPLCKLLWMQHEMPEVFNKAFKFISIKEYVFFKLFNKYIVDYSIASATGLFDIYNLTWFDVALAKAGITSQQLSIPLPPTHQQKGLLKHYQQHLLIDDTIPFILGGNDGCLANLGCGAVTNGEVALTIGTSGAIRMTTDTTRADAKKRLFNYLLTDKIYVTGGPINNGGLVIQWLSKLLGVKDAEAVTALAANAPVGANNLLFLPYLLGERAPIWDANARGVFFGINNLHKQEDFARSVMEGISFALLSIMYALEETNGTVNTIYVSGGFIESAFWLQLLADIFNKPIVVSNADDASATGAAYIAMLALGWIKELQEVKGFLLHDVTYQPNADNYKTYEKRYRIFASLYGKLKDSFHELAALDA